MKIAILTSGILPVPAVLGGAVENLIDFYLEYNQQHQLHDITVYSIKCHQIKKCNDNDYNHYHYIDTTSIFAKIKRKLYSYTHSSFYYPKHIEYFLHQSLKHLKKTKYDLIILENRPGYAIPVSQISTAKIIIHLHNDLLNANSLYAKKICNCCSSVITVSNYIKGCVESIGSSVKKVTIYNGIDIKQFTSPSYHIKREMLGLNTNDFIIVYSGRINEDKGVKELIQALKLLESYPDIKLLILGGSFFGNEKKQNKFICDLQQEANQVKSSIIFTGFIPYNHVPAYLSIADIAVIPSIWEEPFALTCIEAMSAGLPIIATHSGGIPEICKNGAILVDKSKIIDHLAYHILDLYNNPEKRKELAIAGKKESSAYSKEKYAEHFFKVIAEDYQSTNSRLSAK